MKNNVRECQMKILVTDNIEAIIRAMKKVGCFECKLSSRECPQIDTRDILKRDYDISLY